MFKKITSVFALCLMVALSAAPLMASAQSAGAVSINLNDQSLGWYASGYGSSIYWWLKPGPQPAAQGTVTISGGSYTIGNQTFTSAQELANAIMALGRQISAQTFDVAFANFTLQQRQVYLLGTTALTLAGTPYVYLPSPDWTGTASIPAAYQGVAMFTPPTPAVIVSPGITGPDGTSILDPLGLFTSAQANFALAQVQQYHPTATLHDARTDYGAFVTDYKTEARRFWVIQDGLTDSIGRPVAVDPQAIMDLAQSSGGTMSLSQLQKYETYITGGGTGQSTSTSPVSPPTPPPPTPPPTSFPTQPNGPAPLSTSTLMAPTFALLNQISASLRALSLELANASNGLTSSSVSSVSDIINASLTTIEALINQSYSIPQAGTSLAGNVKIVSINSLNIRSAPNTSASIIGQFGIGSNFTSATSVQGESVNGVSTWWVTPSGGYVWAGGVE